MKPTAAISPISRPDLPPISSELRRLLEDDILRRGVMVPILVAHDGDIIDGRLRHHIAMEHGLPCPKIVVGRLTEEDRADLRLAVNLYRKHLTQAQIRELIAWELRRRPDESDRQVAGRIGVDHKTVGSARRRLEGIGEIPQCDRKTKDGRRYPATRKPVVITNCEAQARVASRLLDELGDDVPGGPLSVRTLKNLAFQKRVEDEAAGPAGKLPPEITIKTGDFRKFDWRPYEGRIAMVMADPPWLDDHAELRRPFAELAALLLRPGGVICCYTGTYGLPGWFEAFSTVPDLKYLWTVASINQKDGKVRVHGRGRVPIQSAWRPILIYSKGDMVGDRVLYDVINSASQEKTHHRWQQPAYEALALIRTFTRPSDWIADPTCGSASSACACVEAGQGRRYIGLDKDAEAVKIARKRVAEASSVPQGT